MLPGPHRACKAKQSKAKPRPCGSACLVPPALSPGLFRSLRSAASPSHRRGEALLCRPARGHRCPSALHVLVGWREAPEPISLDAAGYLPLQMEAGEVTSLARRHGVLQAGLLFAQMRRVLSHLAACRPAPPRGSICGVALAKPVNHAHIKAPAAQALTTPAAGSERTVPVQMFISSFSQLQRAAEFTRKPRERKESRPVEGLQQSPCVPCSFMGQVRPAHHHLPPF